LPDAASLDRTDAVIRRMSDLAMKVPGVAASVAFPGLSPNGFTASPNSGIAFITLDDFEKRRSPDLSANAIIGKLYENAFKALKPGGRLLVHDFMVNDSLDGPALGSLWALQHVTVNAGGLGLTPAEVISRMTAAGFAKCETMEMINGLTKLIVAFKK
jgi:multidrug efflux pump subunit AcrB